MAGLTNAAQLALQRLAPPLRAFNIGKYLGEYIGEFLKKWLEDQLNNGPGGGLFIIPGFRLINKCQGIPPGIGFVYGGIDGACVSYSYANTNPIALGTPIPWFRTRLDVLWQDKLPNGDPIYRTFQRYGRPSVDPLFQPTPAWSPQPAKLPWAPPKFWPFPAIDPLTLPIGVPVPAPNPIPWPILPGRKPNPYRDPLEQPRRGPAPARRPRPDYAPRLNRRSPYLPVNRPGIEIWPNVGARVWPGHKYAPARPREKEPKFIANPQIPAGIEAIGEGIDALEAIWGALPEGCQLNGDTPQGMALDLFNCSGGLDPWKLLQNLLGNAAEDFAFGALGGAAAEAAGNNPFYNRPVGPGTGPAL
jgi:hypothetical protein